MAWNHKVSGCFDNGSSPRLKSIHARSICRRLSLKKRQGVKRYGLHMWMGQRLFLVEIPNERSLERFWKDSSQCQEIQLQVVMSLL